ncbi:MAG: N-acetylmuramoyl-L-alanine amidase [Cyclobacteriaceae bacterium]
MIDYFIESSVLMAVTLLCYFILFSRGKYFSFNRFYLLGALCLSLIIPLVDIETNSPYAYFDDSHGYVNSLVLSAVVEGESYLPVQPADVSTPVELSATDILFGLYLLGVVMMFGRFVLNLIRLYRLVKKSEMIDKGDYRLVLIHDLVGPFSFWKYVFVNREEHEKGVFEQVVLEHELAHVQGRHSLDILFIELLLIPFFISPFVWLFRYGIRLNHEYSADDIALRIHSDLENFVNHLIHYNHSRATRLLECNFNYLSTKKRLMMLSKTKNSAVLFGNKMALAVAVVAMTCAVLSFKTVSDSQIVIEDNANFTVLIDLGHGGKDPGTQGADGGLTEAEIVEAIGSEIEKMDTKIKLVFSRKSGEFISLSDRVALSDEVSADLMLSLHASYFAKNSRKGLEVYYSEENASIVKSMDYARKFLKQMDFRGLKNPAQPQKANFFVLKNPTCPSILLNLGYLSNSKDLNYLSDNQNQQQLAQQIVRILEGLQ